MNGGERAARPNDRERPNSSGGPNNSRSASSSSAPNSAGAANNSRAANSSSAPNTPRPLPAPTPWHDARRLPRPPRDARRVEPRAAAIWVRVGGRWLPGHIQCWFAHRGRWACWLSYQADPAHPTVAAMWGLFAYEPAAILSRTAHPTPPEQR